MRLLPFLGAALTACLLVSVVQAANTMDSGTLPASAEIRMPPELPEFVRTVLQDNPRLQAARAAVVVDAGHGGSVSSTTAKNARVSSLLFVRKI